MTDSPLTVSAKVAAVLASVISLGFFAWAGVVWSVQDSLRELLYDISNQQAAMRVLVENMDKKMEQQRDLWLRHEVRPWHDQAGNTLSIMRLEINNLRERLQENNDGRP